MMTNATTVTSDLSVPTMATLDTRDRKTARYDLRMTVLPNGDAVYTVGTFVKACGFGSAKSFGGDYKRASAYFRKVSARPSDKN
jgi:hypothetical protein